MDDTLTRLLRGLLSTIVQPVNCANALSRGGEKRLTFQLGSSPWAASTKQRYSFLICTRPSVGYFRHVCCQDLNEITDVRHLLIVSGHKW